MNGPSDLQTKYDISDIQYLILSKGTHTHTLKASEQVKNLALAFPLWMLIFTFLQSMPDITRASFCHLRNISKVKSFIPLYHTFISYY